MPCRAPCMTATSWTPRKSPLFLRRAGYSDKEGQSLLGSFRLVSDGIEITPGPELPQPEEAHISIQGGQVDHITSKGNELSAYELEPQLVTALFDANSVPNARW
jgi:hypothetical protein